jgi:PIN domain nuclease of toxin-antitoxin system
MPVGAARAAELFAMADYSMLSITPQHTVAISALPQHMTQADPFDRLLVS